ncbi:putative tetratricopeptide-like helical domain superfamily, DYW domain-containing protein [Helianthus annuus]|nr:putative tetratricopeptide-like helical domain superfamily, DYW domain-containing protein [Helianthus annuus]
MYAKAGGIHEARFVFENLPERDVVSWTAIISGYAQLGLDEEALELFRRLLREGIASNYVTYASVLTAVSGLAAYEMGKQIHSHVLRSGLPFYVVLQNSLIDMYTKCGQLSYAWRVFDKMSERTVISWNAMLVGYSKHGMAREVASLFELMRNENQVKPNNVTFLAILSGCSHGKMENKGLEVYDKMKELLVKLKEHGYSRNLSGVLYDVDDEQKEKILLGHSEKLALAFGLIYSPVVSQVCEREVFMRDKNRFHHIVNGVCSCGDYW